MSVGWRSQGGLRNEESFQCISKGACIGKGPRRVERDQALRMLDMADCTHSHVIMVLGDAQLEFGWFSDHWRFARLQGGTQANVYLSSQVFILNLS